MFIWLVTVLRVQEFDHGWTWMDTDLHGRTNSAAENSRARLAQKLTKITKKNFSLGPFFSGNSSMAREIRRERA